VQLHPNEDFSLSVFQYAHTICPSFDIRGILNDIAGKSKKKTAGIVIKSGLLKLISKEVAYLARL
jgi:hypothetical protein